MAITGKPLAATAGAKIFEKGGNAVDAACAMLAATCTMFDVLSWGGETQALIYNPKTKKVIAINALGVAPTGATLDFFKKKGYEFPPWCRTIGCRYTWHTWWLMLYVGKLWHYEFGASIKTGYGISCRLSY